MKTVMNKDSWSILWKLTSKNYENSKLGLKGRVNSGNYTIPSCNLFLLQKYIQVLVHPATRNGQSYKKKKNWIKNV